jgi:hypothetical protein
MPKLIDWGVRYELIREAVVRIAARHGAAEVSITSVAAELHVSASTLRRTVDWPGRLPDMGVSLLVRTRRHRRLLRGRPQGTELGSLEHYAFSLLGEVPCDEEEVEEQRAWVALTGAGATDVNAEARRVDEEHLDLLVARWLARLEVEAASEHTHAVHVRAILDGLVAARCRGTATFEEAQECLADCLRLLSAELRSGLSPSGS